MVLASDCDCGHPAHFDYSNLSQVQQRPFPIIVHPSASLPIEIVRLIDAGIYYISTNDSGSCYLAYKDNALTIHLNKSNEPLSVCIDFVGGKAKHRRQYGGGKNQPLAKACGLYKHPQWNVFDATAGLGKDAFVLASLGAKITLCERHPALYGLLLDALRRGLEDESVGEIIQRMSCVRSDAIAYFETMDNTSNTRPDVIYLDPMYPSRKKSAKIKKEMQVLQELVAHTGDEGRLLSSAIKIAGHRVVVKRPKSAGLLNNVSPSYSVSSVNTRYDIYVS